MVALDYCQCLHFELPCLSHDLQVSAARVENVDLSHIIGSNHFNYNRKMPEILPLLALDECSKYVGMGGAGEDTEGEILAREGSLSSMGDGSSYKQGSSAAAHAEAVDATVDCVMYGSTVVP